MAQDTGISAKKPRKKSLREREVKLLDLEACKRVLAKLFNEVTHDDEFDWHRANVLISIVHEAAVILKELDNRKSAERELKEIKQLLIQRGIIPQNGEVATQ